MSKWQSSRAPSGALGNCSLKSEYMTGKEILTMLQFYNFLTLLSEYRQAITQYESETITMIFNTVTDFRLSIDLVITIEQPANVEAKTSISLSVNDDGEVKAEILDGTYSARMLSLIEYATLIMYNLVNTMLSDIEKAKSEVLGSE